jgi:hypothetical protein
MTKDLNVTVLQPNAKSGQTVDQPAAYKFEIDFADGTEKTILVGWNQIQMVLDKTNNYMEVKSNGMLIYGFEQGDTYGGTPFTDAENAYATLEPLMVA